MRYRNEHLRHFGNTNRPIPIENEKKIWMLNEVYEASRFNLWGVERSNQSKDFNGTDSYIELKNTTDTLADSKKFTVACWLQKHSSATLKQIFHMSTNSGTTIAEMYYWTTDFITLDVYNSTPTLLTSIFFASHTWTASEWHHVAVSMDLGINEIRFMVDGEDASGNWSAVTNDNIAFSNVDRINIGAFWNGTSRSDFMDGQIAQLYINTREYIDFRAVNPTSIVLV